MVCLVSDSASISRTLLTNPSGHCQISQRDRLIRTLHRLSLSIIPTSSRLKCIVVSLTGTYTAISALYLDYTYVSIQCCFLWGSCAIESLSRGYYRTLAHRGVLIVRPNTRALKRTYHQRYGAPNAFGVRAIIKFAILPAATVPHPGLRAPVLSQVQVVPPEGQEPCPRLWQCALGDLLLGPRPADRVSRFYE